MRSTLLEELIVELEKLGPKDAWPRQCPLRRAQFEAFTSVKRRLSIYTQFGRITPGAGTFIVQMATGTGKTGAIALCAFGLDAYPRVLIVVPSDLLRTQLRTALSRTSGGESFWEKTQLTPARRPKLSASRGVDFSVPTSRDAPHITVTTAHSLNSYVRRPNGGPSLDGKFDLVIFDEGHKKPAPRWSESTDSLGVPIVLFTATPYRADGRPLGGRTIFRHTFVDGLTAGTTLKRVEFRQLEKPGNLRANVEQLCQAFRSEYGAEPAHSRPKLLVRASGVTHLEEVVRLFKRKLRTVGLHSSFARTPNASKQLTANRSEIKPNTEVVVHQHMLLEGFDDPRVGMVAFLQPPEDARLFIQQIGRAVRWDHSASSTKQTAIIYHPDRKAAEATWHDYLAFEKSPDDYAFHKNRFVRRADSFAKSADQLLRLRPSVRIRRLKGGRSPKTRDALVKSIQNWIQRQSDLQLMGHTRPEDGDLPCEVFLMQRVRTPSFLKDAFYEDKKLELLVVGLGAEFAFIQCTMGRLPDAFRDWAPISPDQISRLVPHVGSAIHTVLLRNLHLSAGSVRSRSIWADDAAHHITFSKDGSFAPIRLGWNDATAPGSRSVGLSTSSYNDSRPGTLEQWLAACAELEGQLGAKSSAHRLFSNVAQVTSEDPDVPYLLQLDVPEDVGIVQGGVSVQISDGLLFAELSCNRSEFTGPLCGGQSGSPAVSVSFDPERRTYNLAWMGVDGLEVEENGTTTDLLRWAKDKGRYSVAAENGVTYVAGRFFRQREPDSDHLKRYAEAVQAYSACRIEVSGHGSPANCPWDTDSVFGVFETRHLGDFTTLICDDGPGEWADFVGFDTKAPRIVLVHAKCSRKGLPGVQVADLYEVCGQAVKNCFHLHELIDQDRYDRWTSEVHKNRQRLRTAQADALKTINDLYRNPRTRREVWVIQASLDTNKLLVGLDQPLTPGMKRIAYLIDQTASAVASAGAELRIFGH